MGILRGIEPELIHPLIDAVSDAGLETIEITMNTKGVETIIKQFSVFENIKPRITPSINEGLDVELGETITGYFDVIDFKSPLPIGYPKELHCGVGRIKQYHCSGGQRVHFIIIQLA